MANNKYYLDRYNKWLNLISDEVALKELNSMTEEQKEDAFYKDLTFGTSGARAIMGMGTNRMNIYTVGRITEAICKLLRQIKHNVHPPTINEPPHSVVITYDTRHNSKLFAQHTACVFARYGIKVYITSHHAPTPYLSYLVPKLNCTMGINITSSHNPREYNGYKVYDSGGYPIDNFVASLILEKCEQVDPFLVFVEDFDKLVADGAIQFVPDEYEDDFLSKVFAQRFSKTNDENISVVYTALNGVGTNFAKRVFEYIGLKNINYVDSEILPNPDFTTCPYPNPESPNAYIQAILKGFECGADLLVANDPDADRLGVMVKDGATYTQISGNDVGIILTNYILKELSASNALPERPTVIRSVVTNSFVDKVVYKYNGKIIKALTGFKNLLAQKKQLEKSKHASDLVLTFEESCGYLRGSHCADKDSFVPLMLIIDLADELKMQGKTLLDYLAKIKSEIGEYINCSYTHSFTGKLGEIKRTRVMDLLREFPPVHIGHKKIREIVDFQISPPNSTLRANILKFVFYNGITIYLRPSGTEPILKYYITIPNGDEKILSDMADGMNKIIRRYSE